jgi:acylglycerol lipase
LRLFRYAFEPSDVELSEQVAQPFSLGIFSFAPPSGDISVRRGFFEGRRRYRLPYRLWLPSTPKAVVILLHGAFDYAGAFDALCPELAARGYATLAYDQRGFGETRTRGRWSGGKTMARDVASAVAMMTSRVPDVPIFLVGESMGGAIAVRAAGSGMLPNVAGMVLVAPGALASNLRRVIYALIARVLRALGGRAEFFAQRVRGDDLSAEAAIRLLADPLVLRRVTPAILSGLFNAGCAAVDLAPRVRIPSLTLVGSREDVSQLSCVRQLHARLGGEAEWEEFKGGPHMLLHWEESARVLERIFQWLDARVALLAQGASVGEPVESSPDTPALVARPQAPSLGSATMGPNAVCAAGR